MLADAFAANFTPVEDVVDEERVHLVEQHLPVYLTPRDVDDVIEEMTEDEFAQQLAHLQTKKTGGSSNAVVVVDSNENRSDEYGLVRMLSVCEMSEKADTGAVCVEADVNVIGNGSENARVIPDEIAVDNRQENEDVVEQNDDDDDDDDDNDVDDDILLTELDGMVYVEVKVDDLVLNNSGNSGVCSSNEL
ncbi:nucleoplasmin-like protein NO29 [Schistocerca piceifrons]|uniref:nucleoplasmin-like protein NO29 n=1 Tax=Schistocerca piceifrons TaxID=274613 RepID=UPI001F5EFBD5|nr:nucleoplasmin-like protein NO29 [Schistocerca piceifrons]